MAYGDIQLPSFIAWGAVGLMNGLVLGGTERWFGLQGMGFFGKLLGYGLAGTVSFFFVDLLGMVFPSWRASQKIIVKGKMGSGLFAYLGSILASGAINGWTFWLLMSLSLFRNAGWLGTLVVGVLSLTFYGVIALPILQAIFGGSGSAIVKGDDCGGKPCP